MGLPVLILGKSGTGKTASMRNFKKEEVGVVNVLGKRLPFKNDLACYVSDDYRAIKQVLLKSKNNTIVIDDAGYLITNQFMRGHGSGKAQGSSVFDLYNALADNFWSLINFIAYELPDEKIVYLMMHEDKNDFGDVKPKTIGKMLDDKVCLEGLFTIVLRSVKSDDKHLFKTISDGLDVCKTPMNMFEDDYIDNDLKVVTQTIRNYYKGE